MAADAPLSRGMTSQSIRPLISLLAARISDAGGRNSFV
jgi:hypothetical protein